MRVVCSWFFVVFEGDAGCSCKRKRRLGYSRYKNRERRCSRVNWLVSENRLPCLKFTGETFHISNKLAIFTNKEL